MKSFIAGYNIYIFLLALIGVLGFVGSSIIFYSRKSFRKLEPAQLSKPAERTARGIRLRISADAQSVIATFRRWLYCRDEGSDQLPKSQRAALVCIALGKEASDILFEQCKQEERDLIGYWIEKLEHSPAPVIENALQEFEKLFENVEDLPIQLPQIHGISEATDLSHVQRLYRAGKEELRSLLASVPGLQIALQLYYLRVERSAFIFEAMTADKQMEVVLGFEQLYDIPREEREALLIEAARYLGNVAYYDFVRNKNALALAAEILGAMQLAQQKRLLEVLHVHHHDLCTRLKNQSFLMENIYPLTHRQFNALTAQADHIDLLLSLLEGSIKVKDKVLSSIGEEERRRIEQNLFEQNLVTPRKIELAQLRIGGLVHRIRREGMSGSQENTGLLHS